MLYEYQSHNFFGVTNISNFIIRTIIIVNACYDIIKADEKSIKYPSFMKAFVINYPRKAFLNSIQHNNIKCTIRISIKLTILLKIQV